MKKYFLSLTFIACFYIIPLAANQNGSTGLPLPRFATLKADTVNMRKGPGRDYHIIWTYQKQNYPVKIIAEYKNWRKVKDHYNHVGWVHKALLSGKKSVMVVHTKQTLVPIFNKPRDNAELIAYAEPFALGTFIKCNAGWCAIEFDGASGWVNKNFIWGILD